MSMGTPHFDDLKEHVLCQGEVTDVQGIIQRVANVMLMTDYVADSPNSYFIYVC